MTPGQMQFTRILSLPSSSAAVRVRLITAALAALYAWRRKLPLIPAIDAVEMIDPPPALRIGSTECLIPKKTALSRIAKVLSQSASVVVSIDPTAPITPALL